MRSLMVLLALVATPFIASVAQDRESPPPAPGDIHGERHSDARPDDVDRQHDDDKKYDDDKKCEKVEHSEQAEHGSREADADRSHDRHARHHHERDQDAQCGSGSGSGSPAPVGEIHGSTFLDLNANGIRDPLEPGVSGWVIQLSGPVNRTATSDNMGNYAFTGLPAGTYTVCEVQQNLWMQTGPKSGAVCAPLIFGYTIVLTGGQVVTGIDFGDITGLIG